MAAENPIAGVIAKAFVDIRPEGGGFLGSLKGIVASATGALGPVGVGLGALAGGAIAVGGAAFAIGEKFEGAYNKIKVATGATGSQLKGLEGDFKTVLSGTAGSFDQVAAAIAGVAQRTGLTGKALDEYAKKEVVLGRITKTDVGENVQVTTALFNKFGIAVGDQSKTLDVLFKASQIGGKGIAGLTEDMTRAQPVLAGLGLSFSQQAGLVATLEKSGVRAQGVIMGLSKEFGAAAKAGKDPITVISDLVAQIKAAHSPTEQMSIAVKTLGARAGGEFVAAVRSGAFSLKDLAKGLTDGKGGILETGASVSTLGSKFARLKNEVLVALEPIATKVVELANVGMAKLVDAFGHLQEAVKPVIAGFRSAFSGEGITSNGIVGIAERIGVGLRALVDGFHGVATSSTGWVHALQVVGQATRTVFDYLREHARPILIGLAVAFGLMTAPITTVATGLVLLYTRSKTFRDIIDPIARFIKTNLIPVLGGLAAILVTVVVPAFIAWTTATWAQVAAWLALNAPIVAAVAAVGAIGFAVVYAYKHFAIFREVVDAVAHFFEHNFVPIVQTVAEVVTKVFSTISDVVSGAVRFIAHHLGLLGEVLLGVVTGGLGPMVIEFVKHFDDIVSFLQSIPGRILAALQALPGLLIQAGVDLIAGFIVGLLTSIVLVYDFFTKLVPKLIGYWLGAEKWLISKGIDLLTGLLGGLWRALPTVADFFLSLPGKILGFIGDVVTKLIPKGLEVVYGLLVGLGQGELHLMEWLAGLPGRILVALPGMASTLIHVGWDLIAGLVQGIIDKAGDVVDAIKKHVTDALPGFVKKFLGISSPSTVFAAFGRNIMEGLALGISSNANLPTNALSDVARRLRTGPFVIPSLAGAAPSPMALAQRQGFTDLFATGRPGRDGGWVFEKGAVVVHNPLPERASETVPYQLRKLALIIGPI